MLMMLLMVMVVNAEVLGAMDSVRVTQSGGRVLQCLRYDSDPVLDVAHHFNIAHMTISSEPCALYWLVTHWTPHGERYDSDPVLDVAHSLRTFDPMV